MFLFASLLLSTTLALAPFDATAALESPHRHVRSQDRSVRQLLKRGFTRSVTFRNLMAQLQQSDVIVYIEQVPRLPGALEGRMMMLPTAHGQRYVRIQITLRGAPDDAVAVLGHELQHALEVAQEDWVFDQATMKTLYQRIGTGTLGGHHVYDTLAAQEVGRIVRRELLA
jgi:hypothetical protein